MKQICHHTLFSYSEHGKQPLETVQMLPGRHGRMHTKNDKKGCAGPPKLVTIGVTLPDRIFSLGNKIGQ